MIHVCPSVPQPGVDVTLSHTAPLYAGTGLTLTCTVTLDPNVDNSERITTEWSGIQDIPVERYSVTGASGSGITYTDSLTISPLADHDDGTYTCTATVTGGSNIEPSSANDGVTITVMGEGTMSYVSFCAFFTLLPLSSTPRTSSDDLSRRLHRDGWRLTHSAVYSD